MRPLPLLFLLAVPALGQGSDDCANPTPITLGPGLSTIVPWDNTAATTSGFDGGNGSLCFSPLNPDGTAGGQVQHDLFFHFQGAIGSLYTFSTVGSTGVTDTRLNVHQGSDCSAVCLGSSDDVSPTDSHSSHLAVVGGCFSQAEFLIQVGSEFSTDVGPGQLEIQLVGQVLLVLANVCGPGELHHDGDHVTICEGSTLGNPTGSGLHLEATGGPAGEFGFFLVSDGASQSLPVFQGVLCLDSPQGRYNAVVANNQGLPQLNSLGLFDANGVLQNISGTSTTGSGFDVPDELPFTPQGQTIAPGNFYCFQLWYRDQDPTGAPSANFSDAICASIF